MARWWSRYPRTASGWFARLHNNGTDPETDSRFRRWLSADPRNEQSYADQGLLWELSGELAHDPELDALAEDATTGSPECASSSRWSRSLRLGVVALACIAALTVIGWTIGFVRAGKHEEFFVTNIGEERQVALPDHSAMTLNTATRVRVIYGRSARTAVLEQGEATFNVVHDPARPFAVAAAGGTALALGTQFNVLASGSRVTVAVLEGRVTVSASTHTEGGSVAHAAAVVVTDGEQVSYAGDKLERPEPANITRIRGWHAGRIVLNDVALADAIAEFNRYSRVPLQLGNPSLATRRITGVFRSGETEAFLDALKEAFELRVERTSTSIVLR